MQTRLEAGTQHCSKLQEANSMARDAYGEYRAYLSSRSLDGTVIAAEEDAAQHKATGDRTAGILPLEAQHSTTGSCSVVAVHLEACVEGGSSIDGQGVVAVGAYDSISQCAEEVGAADDHGSVGCDW